MATEFRRAVLLPGCGHAQTAAVRDQWRHPGGVTPAAGDGTAAVVAQVHRRFRHIAVQLLWPSKVPKDRGDAALQFVLFGPGQRGRIAIGRNERFPDELARRAPVVVASPEQDRRLGEIRDPCG